MKKKLLMGIDVGTSACKVSVYDHDGTEVTGAECEYPIYYPKPYWVEQDPDEWYQAIVKAIRECLRDIDPACIAGIGTDGQSWSCIPVDSHGKLLSRTPIWMDMRCDGICKEVLEEVNEDEIFRIAKNPFQPSYTTPKILWFKKYHKDIYDKTAYFLQSNSYIIYRLTGVISQDKSQGYGLHIYDMDKGRYDPKLAGKLGIDISKLPPVYECDQIVGRTTQEAALLTGIPEGVPVVAGGLDAACGSLGAGVYRTGQTQEQGGQAGGMSICEDSPAGDRRLILSNHVVPGLWLLQGGTVAGGAAYRWIAEAIGQSEAAEAEKCGKNAMYLMDQLAGEVPAGSEGLIFLPYLSGERSPVWDPDACGTFFGLDFSKRKGHIYRSVMEGTAFALRHNLDVASGAGARVSGFNSMGGATRSRLWMQIKSDVTGIPIHVPDSDSASTLGAAILAGVGTGVFGSYEEAVNTMIRFRAHYEPDQENKRIYDDLYKIYTDLYENTKDLMKKRKKAVSDNY